MKFLDLIFGRTGRPAATDQTESAQTQVNNTNEKNLFLGGDTPENEMGKDSSPRKGPVIGVPIDMHKTGYPIDEIEIIQDGKYYNYINKDILEDMLKEVDPNSQIVDYFESGAYANVNRPTATWGNYLIKKKK